MRPRRVSKTAIRVNVGGDEYTDSSGQRWEADRAYAPGSWGCMSLHSTDILKTTDNIDGTDDPPLFQTMRVGEELIYRFHLPGGSYRVNLLFAEIYWDSPEAERQDVYIQGERVLRDFNIFDEAGHDRALLKSFRSSLSKGELEIKFVGRSLPMHSGARINAIEIIPSPKGGK